MTLLNKLSAEIKGWTLIRAILMLLPFWILSVITTNPLWIKVALLMIASFIVEDRLKLTPLGVCAHGTTVILCVYLLLFTQFIPVLFVIACALLAATIIRISAEGQKLRSLGTWTFIPAIILANELHDKNTAPELLHEAWRYLPYLFAALIPLFITALIKYRHADRTRSSSHQWFFRLTDWGPKQAYRETMVAIIIGVGLAAFLVEHYEMQNGQWVIWGVASVINGTVDTARTKLRSRIIGVTLGVPLGIVLGQFVIPHTTTNITLATLAVFLTLVSFERYIVAYFFRCTFVALAITLANHATSMALERLTHVVLGGLIGISCVLALHFLVKSWQLRS